MFTPVLALLAAFAFIPALSGDLPCPAPAVELAGCKGCGCRGGPGWRIHRTGKCASWAELARECGNPPDPKRCTKEN